ncbi:hypothetical protein BG011_000468 [Mortierella polycephala]|uniref:Rho-GAP domain-containing protein n=1 Tax=Mortierella polycephala TaxID=41804 RepID=A0A9P6QIV8_9FUNG|nr:hypothetical protein BG011_000468 [Mortierella polycephala]
MSCTSSPPTSASSPNSHAINIVHSSRLEPPQSTPRRGSIAAHLMSFAARSTTSLHILSSSAPTQRSPDNASSMSQDYEMRSQVLPLRTSGFTNPLRKLQNSLQSSSKKSLEFGGPKPEKLASSSSSVNSMVSWRSKGAEMFSKKNWSRTRKNSEPTYGTSKSLPTCPVFGASLEDAVRTSHIQGTPMVPAVLYRCAEYLEAKGVDEVGLYRVPGSHASVQKLKRMFDTGKDLNLLTMDGIDPNDIATLLKLYLRELPMPLLPAVVLEQIQSLITTDRQICHTLRGILIRLPRPNYVVLSYLCHHLSRIAAHSEKTKMNVSNLGVVFAPTLSIGSVLFKALLGGYYDTADTMESREKGLKIVWGGLLQGFEYDVQEWPEDTANEALSPAQEVVNATLAVPAPTPSLQLSQSMPNDHMFPHMAQPTIVEPSEEAGLADNEDESKLMAAMLLREELATKRPRDDETASNASSSSSSIPCTDTTALSTVSSPGMNAKDQAFEASFTSPSMPFATIPSPALIPPSDLPLPVATVSTTAATAEEDVLSSTSAIPIHSQDSSLTLSSSTSSVSTAGPTPPVINVTTDTGSLHTPTADPTVTGISQPGSPIGNKENAIPTIGFPHKSTTGAPQLPPLEGLMIVL